MKIRPLADRVLVKPSKADDKTPGGIIIPDAAKEKPVRGEVLAVGRGKTLENGARVSIAVEAGQVVWYGKYVGTEIELDGEKHVILREEDLLGVEE